MTSGVGGERAGKLVRADGRPGHPVADRLGGDHEDARSRQAGEYGGDARGLVRKRPGRLYGSMLAVTGSRHTPVALLGAGLRLLVLAWVFGNPPGAAPDERAHYVRALGAGGLQLAGATFEPTAEQRKAFLGAARRGEPLPGRASRPCCGPAKQTRAFDVPRALSVTTVRLQRPPPGALGDVSRPATRRAAVAAGADLHRHLRAVRLRRPGRGDAHPGLTRGCVASGAPGERADLPRAPDRRGRADRRRPGVGSRWPWR